MIYGNQQNNEDVYKRQVTHSQEIVDQMGKRVITMDRGRVIGDEIKGGHHED